MELPLCIVCLLLCTSALVSANGGGWGDYLFNCPESFNGKEMYVFRDGRSAQYGEEDVQPLTMSLWVKQEPETSGWLMYMRDSTGEDYYGLFSDGLRNKLEFRWAEDNRIYVYQIELGKSYLLDDDMWHQVVISYKNGVLKFWRDGVLGLNEEIGHVTIPQNEPVLIVANDGVSTSFAFKGQVTLVGHTVGWDNGMLLAKAYQYTKSRISHKWTNNCDNKIPWQHGKTSLYYLAAAKMHPSNIKQVKMYDQGLFDPNIPSADEEPALNMKMLQDAVDEMDEIMSSSRDFESIAKNAVYGVPREDMKIYSSSSKSRRGSGSNVIVYLSIIIGCIIGAIAIVSAAFAIARVDSRNRTSYQKF